MTLPSLDALVTCAVIAACAWGLKEGMKTLVTTLITTMAQVQLLDAKLAELISAVGDVQKLRTDLNTYYARLKKLENGNH